MTTSTWIFNCTWSATCLQATTSSTAGVRALSASPLLEVWLPGLRTSSPPARPQAVTFLQRPGTGPSQSAVQGTPQPGMIPCPQEQLLGWASALGSHLSYISSRISALPVPHRGPCWSQPWPTDGHPSLASALRTTWDLLSDERTVSDPGYPRWAWSRSLAAGGGGMDPGCRGPCPAGPGAPQHPDSNEIKRQHIKWWIMTTVSSTTLILDGKLKVQGAPSLSNTHFTASDASNTCTWI